MPAGCVTTPPTIGPATTTPWNDTTTTCGDQKAWQLNTAPQPFAKIVEGLRLQDRDNTPGLELLKKLASVEQLRREETDSEATVFKGTFFRPTSS